MEEAQHIPYTQSAGLDYATLLAFRLTDESTVNKDEKRDLLYSLLCFRCCFDDRMVAEPDPILKKYNCLSRPEPNKLSLYDAVLRLVELNTATTELKAMWYQMFAYVLMVDAPHEEDAFLRLRKVLCTDEVLSEVLKSRFSANIPYSVREMWAADLPPLVVDWYLPYLTFKDERDANGISREVKACQKLLSLGNFKEALGRTERLLDSCPDDENLLLVNIAARVSLPGAEDEKARMALLTETLTLIDTALSASKKPARENYFLYYRGLTLLGLGQPKQAKEQFAALLQAQPDFELAAFMEKMLEKA